MTATALSSPGHLFHVQPLVVNRHRLRNKTSGGHRRDHTDRAGILNPDGAVSVADKCFGDQRAIAAGAVTAGLVLLIPQVGAFGAIVAATTSAATAVSRRS